MRKHRKNSLELKGWAMAAMSEASAKRVADIDQASRAALRVEQGWWQQSPQERGRLTAYVAGQQTEYARLADRTTQSRYSVLLAFVSKALQTHIREQPAATRRRAQTWQAVDALRLNETAWREAAKADKVACRDN